MLTLVDRYATTGHSLPMDEVLRGPRAAVEAVSQVIASRRAPREELHHSSGRDRSHRDDTVRASHNLVLLTPLGQVRGFEPLRDSITPAQRQNVAAHGASRGGPLNVRDRHEADHE